VTEREASARAAFEEALAAFLELPPASFGRMVVHFGSGGECKPALEVQLPMNGRGGPRAAAVPPARVRMPSNLRGGRP
jgi:hypothetical protein